MLALMEWPEILEERTDGNGKQRNVAQRLHVSQQTISSWLGLMTFPEGKNLKALAEYLGVEESELLIAVHEAKRRPKRGPQKITPEWRAEVDERLGRIESLLRELGGSGSRGT